MPTKFSSIKGFGALHARKLMARTQHAISDEAASDLKRKTLDGADRAREASKNNKRRH